MLSFSDFQSFEERLRLSPGRDGFAILSQGGQQHPMHRHAELEFNLVLRGTARYLLGDRRYDLHQQSLVWLFPAQDHVLLERSPDYTHWIVVVRPERIAQVCRSETNQLLKAANPPGYFCRRLSENDAGRLSALLKELITVSIADTFNAGLGYTLLLAWEAYHRADSDGVAGTHVHPAVEQAVRVLRDPESVLLTVPEIATLCHISEAHLTRLFRAQTGQTIVAFRNQERLRRFVDIYGSGRRLSLLEAAVAVGFGSYPQFHRVFKERMGCSPADYRRRVLRSEIEISEPHVLLSGQSGA